MHVKVSASAVGSFWDVARLLRCNIDFYVDGVRLCKYEKIRIDALVLASAWPSLSIPGSAIAIFLNRLLTLCPAFADVSMNMIPSSVDFVVASSKVTCLHNRTISILCSNEDCVLAVYRTGQPCFLPVLLSHRSLARSERLLSILLLKEMIGDLRRIWVSTKLPRAQLGRTYL